MKNMFWKCFYINIHIYESESVSCSVIPDSLQLHGPYSPPGSSVLGILQARILEWVAISFSGGSSRPRDRTCVSCIAGRFFTIWAMREAHIYELLLFSCLVMPDSATPWTAALQASLFITNSWILLRLMSIKLVMPSNHLILWLSLLLLPSIFPNIRVFFNELALCIRWPEYWSSNFSISTSNE